MTTSKKPLAGLKVIDLTSALSGPFCTMFFGDFGAEVIKIEPVSGDQTRGWPPFDEKTGDSGYYANVNRNKKGATLNLKSEKALEMFYKLAKDADIIVENYKGGVTKKLKIDYETIKKINPKIIYASLSGFGEGSPMSHRPCYDVVAQAMGGMVNLTGWPDSDPVKVGSSVGDHVSGIYTAVGILIALHHRDVTGEGQHVDVAMIDSIFSILEAAVPDYTMHGKITERNGNIDPSIAPFDIIPCKDGYIAIGVGNDPMWVKFCKAFGFDDLIDDPRFVTNGDRFKNYQPDLQDILVAWTKKYTKAELEDMMDKVGIPCGPVLNMKEAAEHPHIKARNMIVDCKHPVIGDMKIQGIVPKLSSTPGSVDMPAPTLGQHNCEIFGLTKEQEKQLKEEGVI